MNQKAVTAQGQPAIRVSEERFRKIFEHTNDAIFIVDLASDRIVDVNSRACEMLGYARGELLALGMSDVHPDEMPQLMAFGRGVLEEGSGWTDELSCLTKTGRRLPAEISASVIDMGGNQRMIALVRNIAKRKEAEAALAKQSRQLELQVAERTVQLSRSEKRLRVLLEITRAVSAHLKREGLFQAVAEAVRAVVSFERMAILLATGEEELSLYAWEEGSQSPHEQPALVFPRAGTVPDWVIRHRKPRIVSRREEIKSFPVSYSFLKKEGMESSCVLPLQLSPPSPQGALQLSPPSPQGAPRMEDRALGALVFHSTAERHFDRVDLALLEEVASVVAVALDNSLAYEEITRLKDELAKENVYLQEEIETERKFDEIVGTSAAIRGVLRSVETVAVTDATVLLTGETGTGKGLIARAIHSFSPRRNKALVKVNCGALPAELIESELFGYERGAFTGATNRRLGRFELAHGGTIFLDEIGDLPLHLQVKLLTVLQDGEIQRVGGSETIKVDVRVIAATNRDLEEAVAEGKFRSDLFYRLNVFPLAPPPLRERPEDIPLLVRHFVMKYANKLGRRIDKVPREVLSELMTYPWPGNVRELENLVERAVILSPGSKLETMSLRLEPTTAAPPPTAAPAQEEALDITTLDEVQRRHILSVLELVGWRVSGRDGAAELLGIKPTTLESRMKKLGIERQKT